MTADEHLIEVAVALNEARYHWIAARLRCRWANQKALPKEAPFMEFLAKLHDAANLALNWRRKIKEIEHRRGS